VRHEMKKIQSIPSNDEQVREVKKIQTMFRKEKTIMHEVQQYQPSKIIINQRRMK
jgi:hypothetical protein